MKILITGANGFLASRILQYYDGKYSVMGMGHKDLDITDKGLVEKQIKDGRYDVVLHCAAISDITACEKNPKLSEEINVTGTKNIADACCRTGAKMIFCSSDQVYVQNGITGPHTEDEYLNPPHVYGKQKCRAENTVLEANRNFVCLRLSMMYAADDRERKEHGNFWGNFMAAIAEKKELYYPVNDYRCITNVWDVVKSMEKVFSLPGGAYNLGSENAWSVYETMDRLLSGTEYQKLLKKNQDAFSNEPRILRMNTEKIRFQGIKLCDTLTGLQNLMKTLTF